jgi:hypothetical protein
MTFSSSKWGLGIIITITLLFSLRSPFFSFSREGITNALIGTPKYWFDEASTMDAARGLVDVGRLDIVVAPNETLGAPYYANSPGFTVQVPLAGVFKLFGVGVLQMRVYTLLWLFATVVLMWFVWKELFGTENAFWGTLLVVTFASFYANGKTTVGTLPAFFFLLLAIWLLYVKKNYGWGGVAAALAVVTKPSMFVFIIPAFFLEFIFYEWPNFFSKAAKIVAGALPVFIVWFFIMFPHPFSSAMWQDVASIYTNHYPDPSLISQISNGATWFFTNTTTLYFGGVLLLVLLARFWLGFSDDRQRRVVNFILWFTPFAMIYFLLSPGWFRYLVAFQIFMLLLLAPSLKILFERWQLSKVNWVMLGLAVLQSIVFMFFSQIPSGLDTVQLAEYINKELLSDTQKTIGVIHAEQLAALLPSAQKYQLVSCGGSCSFGVHPLSLPEEKLPNFIIIHQNQLGALSPYEKVLGAHYAGTQELKQDFFIFRKN